MSYDHKQTKKQTNFIYIKIVQILDAESEMFTKGTCVNCNSSRGHHRIYSRCSNPPIPRLKPGGGGYLNFIDNKKCVLFILKINFFHKPKVSLLTLKA